MRSSFDISVQTTFIVNYLVGGVWNSGVVVFVERDIITVPHHQELVAVLLSRLHRKSEEMNIIQKFVYSNFKMLPPGILLTRRSVLFLVVARCCWVFLYLKK